MNLHNKILVFYVFNLLNYTVWLQYLYQERLYRYQIKFVGMIFCLQRSINILKCEILFFTTLFFYNLSLGKFLLLFFESHGKFCVGIYQTYFNILLIFRLLHCFLSFNFTISGFCVKKSMNCKSPSFFHLTIRQQNFHLLSIRFWNILLRLILELSTRSFLYQILGIRHRLFKQDR